MLMETSPLSVITVVCTVVGTLVGSLGGAWAMSIRYSNRLALSERDASQAKTKTDDHAVKIALVEQQAKSALEKAEDHGKALANAQQQIAAMETTFKDIRAGLEQLTGIRTDVGEMKTNVGVLTSQLSDTRTDVQELKKTVDAMRRISRRAPTSVKRRK